MFNDVASDKQNTDQHPYICHWEHHKRKNLIIMKAMSAVIVHLSSFTFYRTSFEGDKDFTTPVERRSMKMVQAKNPNIKIKASDKYLVHQLYS